MISASFPKVTQSPSVEALRLHWLQGQGFLKARLVCLIPQGTRFSATLPLYMRRSQFPSVASKTCQKGQLQSHKSESSPDNENDRSVMEFNQVLGSIDNWGNLDDDMRGSSHVLSEPTACTQLSVSPCPFLHADQRH